MPHRLTRFIGPRPRVLVIVLCVLAALVAGCTSDDAPDAPETENPVLDSSGGTRNVTFYYAGAHPLRPGEDLSALGRPSVVVTTAKADEPAAVDAVHDLGAEAYRYVQFFWAPDDEEYEGVNLRANPDWAFCRSGDRPLLGRRTVTDGRTTDWHFIDANEKKVRREILVQLRSLRSLGWDGVMFDRGGAALLNAVDSDGRPVWNATSSCTDDPHQPGATFADSYVAVLGLAKRAGLQVMLNYGTSPFDARQPLREDAWDQVDLVLNETVAYPRDVAWERTFRANLRSEQDAEHGQRTVGLLTTHTLGGVKGQNRRTVYYEWARVRLFDLPVAVNTGDGGCPPSGTRSGVCNRYGLYPALTNLRLGAPVDDRPVSTACSTRVRCVWSRTYTDGVVAVNVRPRPARGVTFEVPGDGCKHVLDVYSGAPLAGNRCVTEVRLDLPAWSGRPLRLSDEPV